jgi:hypothetical protein
MYLINLKQSSWTFVPDTDHVYYSDRKVFQSSIPCWQSIFSSETSEEIRKEGSDPASRGKSSADKLRKYKEKTKTFLSIHRLYSIK